MYEKDEYVFHETGGVCLIADICSAPLDGMPTDRLYYVMKPVNDPSSVICIPTDSDQIFLRHLLNEGEARSLLNLIPTVEAIEEPNAKQLRARYVECMRTHEPIEWVRVIQTVCARMQPCTSSSKRLSETERSFAEVAKRNLCTELSLSLGIEAREVMSLLPAAWCI